MKQISVRFFVLVFVFLGCLAANGQDPAGSKKPLKLLAIGNSFTGNAMSFFPKIVESNGDRVIFFRAMMGGWSMDKHANAAKAYDANPEDPVGKPYGADFTPPRKEFAGKKFSLREALEAEKWDYVTIQQFSEDGAKAETFEPSGGFLVDYIHKYAPQAKIIAFQTWAYREDYPGFGKDGWTQAKMYEAIAANYEKLAADHNLEVIPVGYAFQNARATERWTFKFPDPNFDYKNPPMDTIPNQPGSLNAGWGWWKPKAGEKGNPQFVLDQKHCNDAGRYLIGCIFYEALLGKDVLKTTYVPEKISPEDAAKLRQIAHDSFASYPGKKVTH